MAITLANNWKWRSLIVKNLVSSQISCALRKNFVGWDSSGNLPSFPTHYGVNFENIVNGGCDGNTKIVSTTLGDWGFIVGTSTYRIRKELGNTAWQWSYCAPSSPPNTWVNWYNDVEGVAQHEEGVNNCWYEIHGNYAGFGSPSWYDTGVPCGEPGSGNTIWQYNPYNSSSFRSFGVEGVPLETTPNCPHRIRSGLGTGKNLQNYTCKVNVKQYAGIGTFDNFLLTWSYTLGNLIENKSYVIPISDNAEILFSSKENCRFISYYTEPLAVNSVNAADFNIWVWQGSTTAMFGNHIFLDKWFGSYWKYIEPYGVQMDTSSLYLSYVGDIVPKLNWGHYYDYITGEISTQNTWVEVLLLFTTIGQSETAIRMRVKEVKTSCP